MKSLRRAAILCTCWLAVSAGAAVAAEEPLVSISPAQQKALDGVYFNCDHEGTLGCLRAECKARGADPAEVQYLYRDAWQNFPELLTPDLRACFVRAGGRFR